jgi:hypothetical protein
MVPRTDFIEKLLTLRVTVAFLGEKEQFAWWTTRFLGPTGQRFLEFSFPRNSFAAGITAASEAAKNFHDKRIGKGRVYHLFRLPQTIEQRLGALSLSPNSRRVLAVLGNKEIAIRAMFDLSKESNTAPEGPVCVGSSKILFSAASISKLAGLYADAFSTAKQTLPYFTGEGG